MVGQIRVLFFMLVEEVAVTLVEIIKFIVGMVLIMEETI
jgi:hypothetical protein